MQGKTQINKKARLIAFYLPQFHPIPENDEWWGAGFTEWTNVAKAKPLFPGHYQPRLPADLGFYDLRVPETRAAQAELARSSGIEGFCYWHYWFGGKRILERPITEVVESGQPDFPFCLGWANQTWTGIWHGAPGRILIEQTYPGREDHERHFYAALPAFSDKRYVRVDGKPLFLVYRPAELAAASEFIEQWQQLASQNGLPGIHFVAHVVKHDPVFDPWLLGFDSATVSGQSAIVSRTKIDIVLARMRRELNVEGPLPVMTDLLVRSIALRERARSRLRRWRCQPVRLFDYGDASLFFLDQEGLSPERCIYPCAVPNWDNSARSGLRALILHNSSPELFRLHFREALSRVESFPPEKRIVFLKSWNEWAEGNYLEPDRKFGHRYLDVVREEVASGDARPKPYSNFADVGHLVGNSGDVTIADQRCVK